MNEVHDHIKNEVKIPVQDRDAIPAQGRDAGAVLHFSEATQRLKSVVNRTPLQLSMNLSRRYNCNVYLKREDLQIVRSYKLRGAYNMMSSLPFEQLK
ncbi:MAG: pyridoxal-phosphate dependent enzyme, partial [Chitinophagaceae bacterium]